MTSYFQAWAEAGGKFPEFKFSEVYLFAKEQINRVESSFDKFTSAPSDSTIYDYVYRLSEVEKTDHYLSFYETKKKSFGKIKSWFKETYTEGVGREHRKKLIELNFTPSTDYQKTVIVEIYKNLGIYKTKNVARVDGHSALSESLSASYSNSIERIENVFVNKIYNHIQNKKINLALRAYNNLKERNEKANSNYHEQVCAFLDSSNRLNNYREAIHFWADNDERGIIRDLLRVEEVYCNLQKKIKKKIIQNLDSSFLGNTITPEWLNFSACMFTNNDNEIRQDEFLWKTSIPKIVFHFLSQFGWSKDNGKKGFVLRKLDTNKYCFEFRLKNVGMEEMMLQIKVNSGCLAATLLKHKNKKKTGLVWLDVPVGEDGLSTADITYLIHELTHIAHFANVSNKNPTYNDTIQLIPNDAVEFPTCLAERLIFDPKLLSYYSSNKGGGKKISYWEKKVDSMNKNFYFEIETFYSYLHELILKSSENADDYNKKINNIAGYQNVETIPQVNMSDFNISTLYFVNRIISEEMAPADRNGYTSSDKIFSLIHDWIDGCGSVKSKKQYLYEWRRLAGKSISESRSSAVENHIKNLNKKKI